MMKFMSIHCVYMLVLYACRKQIVMVEQHIFTENKAYTTLEYHRPYLSDPK